MTSQISSLYVNIDEAYPVAGVDNDTQGFRDNFDVIKSCLAVASTEITTLQETTAKTNGNNDFGGRDITNTVLVTNSEKSFSPGVFTAENSEIQFRNGGHQRIILNADNINLILSWDTTSSTSLEGNRYSKMSIEVSALDPLDAFTVNWAVDGGGDLRYNVNYPANFTVTSIPQVVEFTTYDGGQTVFVNYLGKFQEENNPLNLVDYDTLSEEISSGVVSLTKKITYFEIIKDNIVGESSSLGAGTEGQIKVFVVKSNLEPQGLNGNPPRNKNNSTYDPQGTIFEDMTTSVSLAGWKTSGGGSIKFETVGSGCTMLFTQGKWYCIGNNGATFV